MTTGRRGQLGKTLFRAWLIASAVYIAVISAVSIRPIEAAVQLARQPYVAPVAVHTTGPDNSPESPAVRAAEIAGRQVLIGLAPPFLILWFGWDAWFAVAGFLGTRSPRSSHDD